MMSAVSHEQTRSGSRWPWLIMAVCAMLATPLWLTVTSPGTLPIKRVIVRSSFQHLVQSDLKSLIEPYVDTGLFAVHARQLRQRLQAQPWVNQANVRRVWPDGIKIEIVEKKPVAYWGEHSLLTAEGKVFELPKNQAKLSLPALMGPEGQEKQVLQVYENISKILAPVDMNIKELQLSPSLSWSVKLNNGVTVLLGRNEPVHQVERLQKVYRRIVGDREGEVEQLDMRYPRGMAVRWRKATV